MNGELLLKGYKFSEKIILNLQSKTVLAGEDTFTAFEIFNMLESYFNRKAFSDYYLDKGAIMILNGNKLSGEEFAVFRLRPTVNLTEELKINKKSLLGQVLYALFPVDSESIPLIADVVETNLLSHLNALTEGYGVSFESQVNDIFSLAKILLPLAKEEDGQEISLNEHDQYYCKAMMLDFIARLKVNKKKLLLVELPEYGLRAEETVKLLKLLSLTSIDNVIIYTHNIEIRKVIPHVYNYNVVKDGKLYGFDDYDELETQLKDVLINSSDEQVEQKVIEYIFQFPVVTTEKINLDR